MEDNSRFLVVEKEIGYGEDFILDIPLSAQIKKITGLLVSSTCNQLTQDLKFDTRRLFISESFGYDDFISRINPTHPDYEKDFKDLELFPFQDNGRYAEYDFQHYMKRFLNYLLRYANIKSLSFEYQCITKDLCDANINAIATNASEYDSTSWSTYFSWMRFLWTSTLINLDFYRGLRNQVSEEHPSIYNRIFFDTFFHIDFLNTLIPLDKFEFNLDYSRFMSGTITLSINGQKIIARNTRVSLNQINKTLQNNLIDVGEIKTNGGFLRSTFFSRLNNIDLRHNMGDGQDAINKYTIRIKVKIYIKYEKVD